MKTCVIALFLCLVGFILTGQSVVFPDTLVNERFETDPTPFMVPAPSGDDEDWVNWDVDLKTPLCVENGATPNGWYWEGDLSYANPGETDNNAFTSCSFLDLPSDESHNRNWLILSPVFIPDSTYWLCWRSLAFQGPMFVDGYKVLVSNGSNDPVSGDYTDTVFIAAQMLSAINLGSLDVNAYIYSNGYIQANAYTDTNYYFTGYTPNGLPFYRGRLEPHAVSLKNYANESIYIAFLHDSDDDNLIQVDDIVISNSHTSATQSIENVLFFNVLPNPVRDFAYFSWKMKKAQEGRLIVSDNAGKVVAQQTFGSRDEGQIFFQTQNWTPGIYYCTLVTANSRATTKLVKL
ncbi:MAG TPA: T9SS type A sorting domain-containing protein [Saprospiraceae bacterium]|nr:T9SS type A sorting domain-containing protein [Saprospiraceae bacterium]